jgi:hypothetical protein
MAYTGITKADTPPGYEHTYQQKSGYKHHNLQDIDAYMIQKLF